MVLGQELEMVQNGVLVGPKTRYSIHTEKWVARHKNKPFWQWFCPRNQKLFKTAVWWFQKLNIFSQTEKWIARYENKVFLQWF